jgi:hypothetical protein
MRAIILFIALCCVQAPAQGRKLTLVQVGIAGAVTHDIQNTSGGYIRKYSAASVNSKSPVSIAAEYDGSLTAAGVNIYLNGALSDGTTSSDTLCSGTTQNAVLLL